MHALGESLTADTIKEGSGFCLVTSATRYVELQTHIQDWTHVCILTSPMASSHWIEAEPIKEYLEYGWMIFSVYFGENC